MMDKLQYDVTRKRCDLLIVSCYNDFKKKAVSDLKTRPKYFWNIFKDNSKNSASLPNIMTLHDEKAKGGQRICELFSKHFQSVYLNVSSSNFTNHRTSHYNNFFHGTPYNMCIVREDEVLKQLLQLDVNKGPGPDSIPPIFLKKCACNLSKPLTIIFNHSLRSGVFPVQWKIAHLTPIHKGGNLDNIVHYRPISILSAIGKVLEAIVNKKLLAHFRPLLDSNQHGFLPRRSTNTNLVDYVSDILDEMDSGGEVHAIYTDFRKAFDLVNHDYLLCKLTDMGIHGSLLRWCESYIRNRSQLVCIRGFKSRVCTVPSGVPQGSHLGPLFFLVYINDIKHVIRSKFKLYADDLKIYRTIHTQSDELILQTDLNDVQKWSSENHMFLNLDKCYHIKFSRKKHPSQTTYYINNIPLTEVKTIRDLWVILDSAMSFRFHVDNITAKCSQLSGFINRQM
ncbi:hypothetical protein O3G_MSEX004133 [Manduca sexta]|uniref:Reverse transcriptase domain-containing protein n=1 Tax=Manduca sexta TaxID=7130 RepID=A0A922CGF9_MANSE|nr:hypothetical protein O3G_MSEX004133 [Manduca sexta]